MKIHLLRPGVDHTLCGLKRGQYTTNPDVADCKKCRKLYEYHTYHESEIMLGWPHGAGDASQMLTPEQEALLEEDDMTYDVGWVKCAEPECEARYKNHRWGRIKADDWFHQKDGTSWCPDHQPDWVAAWRAKRKAGIPPEPWKIGGKHDDCSK